MPGIGGLAMLNKTLLTTVGLLIASNVFMTFAWYAHLKELNHRPWYVAALLSWGIALVEYLFQVPGNRIGYTVMELPQLKVLQEVITLLVFAPFVVLRITSYNVCYTKLLRRRSIFSSGLSRSTRSSRA